MAKSAVLAPLARRDLLGATRWIAKDNPTAAVALRDAVFAAARRIGEHPHIGVIKPTVASEAMRFVMLTGFSIHHCIQRESRSSHHPANIARRP